MSVEWPVNMQNVIKSGKSPLALGLDLAGIGMKLGSSACQVQTPQTRVQELGQECVATHTKGRTVISSRLPSPAKNIEEPLEFWAGFEPQSARLLDIDRRELTSWAKNLGPVTAQSIAIRIASAGDFASEGDRRLAAARAGVIAECLAMQGIDACSWYAPAGTRGCVEVCMANTDKAEIVIVL